ncbi:hypothetical protein BsWGS_13500 [Bradybaena similaris]
MDDFAEEEVVENPTIRAAYNLAPLHQNQPLRWDYEVHLIGEKIYDKVIHLCETCELPILVYGRLLPCKHIFCFDCARKCDKSCKRCSAKVQKVEKSALGTVYVCTHGAPKHSTKGCRRTYLSQRDLQAHIAHRHMPKSSSSSSSSSANAQPVPNQLPLTKQQAAQQAAQKQIGTQDMHHAPPVQAHLQQSVLPGQNPLVSAMAPHLLSHQQSAGGLPVNPQQISPATQLIPALSDLRPMATGAQSGMGHNSPLMQPSPNPSAMPQGMGLPYGSAPQGNPDMFHSLDMGQQQPLQQTMGIPGAHMQPGQPHQPYPQPTQFPPPAPGMMQQMTSQQLSSSVASPLHQAPFPHSHTPMSGPPNIDNYNDPQNMPQTQPRTNVNLITVPIQDEGQYRPLPLINPSMGPNPAGPYPQTRPSMPSQTLAYTQPVLSSGTYSTPTTFPQMAAQPPPHMPGPNSPQGLPFNQPNVIHPNNPGHIVNSRLGIGGNIHQGGPRAMVGVHQMSAGPVRPHGGDGLMPTPVGPPGGPGVINRFPPGGQWPPQRMMQPRMTQGQQQQRPPHTESQFQPQQQRPSHTEGQFQQQSQRPSHTEGQFQQQSQRPPHSEGQFQQQSQRPPLTEGQFQQLSQRQHIEGEFQRQPQRPPHAEGEFQWQSQRPPHAEGEFQRQPQRPPHTEDEFQRQPRRPSHNEGEFQRQPQRPPHTESQFQQQPQRPQHAESQFQQQSQRPPHSESQFQQQSQRPPHSESQFQQQSQRPPHSESQFQQSNYYH